MLSCQQMAEIVSAYIEGELPLGKRLGIGLHLMVCRHCRRYFDQVRKVSGDLERVAQVPVPDDVADALNKLFAAPTPPDSEAQPSE